MTYRKRDRTWQYGRIAGSWYKNGVTGTSVRDPVHVDHMIDWAGGKDTDNPFYLSKITHEPAIVSGGGPSSPGQTIYTKVSGCVVQCTADSALGSFVWADNNSLITLGMARTNPGRAHVQLPVFIVELREFPELIYKAGKTLLGSAGKTYLTWQMGWKPLISDLAKMLDFQEVTERRFREIRKMATGKAVSRRYDHGTQTLTGVKKDVALDSFLTGIRGNVTTVSTQRKWSVVSWRPNTDGLPQTAEEQFALAKRSVLGLRKGQITSNVWEALPWSWMVDWFTNVGDYLVATDNSVAMAHNGIGCLMTKSEVVARAQLTYVPNWVSVSGQPRYTVVTKERVLGYPSPLPTSMPILNGGHFATLSALVAARGDAYRKYRK